MFSLLLAIQKVFYSVRREMQSGVFIISSRCAHLFVLPAHASAGEDFSGWILDKLVGLLASWLMERRVSWLPEWLTCLFGDWLAGRLAGYLVVWLFGWLLVGWLVSYWFPDWLAGWINCLTGWQCGWLMERWMHSVLDCWLGGDVCWLSWIISLWRSVLQMKFFLRIIFRLSSEVSLGGARSGSSLAIALSVWGLWIHNIW